MKWNYYSSEIVNMWRYNNMWCKHLNHSLHSLLWKPLSIARRDIGGVAQWQATFSPIGICNDTDSACIVKDANLSAYNKLCGSLDPLHCIRGVLLHCIMLIWWNVFNIVCTLFKGSGSIAGEAKRRHGIRVLTGILSQAGRAIWNINEVILHCRALQTDAKTSLFVINHSHSDSLYS